MRCQKCGSPLDKGNSFCGVCGNKVERPSSWMKLVVYTVAGLAVLGASFLGWRYISQNTTNNSANNSKSSETALIISPTILTNKNNDTTIQSRTITNNSLEITTASLSDGKIGEYYSENLAANGGNGNYTWSLDSGTLPTGLSLDSPTGTLKGTPVIAGDYTFSIRVCDTNTGMDTQPFAITVTGDLEITNVSLPEGIEDKYYSEALAANGGNGAFTWSQYSGILPTGLSLRTSTGTLEGTPTEVGEYSFTINVEDTHGNTDTRSFTINIKASRVEIITTSLANGTVDEYYNEEIEASGGSGKYTWSLDSGALPYLMKLNGRGEIWGSLDEIGEYSFTISVKDEVSGDIDTQSFTLTVIFGEEKITTSSLKNGIVGHKYSETMVANFDVTSSSGKVWTIYDGTLPPGMTLSSSGSLYGYLTTAGDYTFSVMVKNSKSGYTDTKTFTLTIEEGEVNITTSLLDKGTVGKGYSETLVANNGSWGEYVWTIQSGTLPPGLYLESPDIDGTPTTAGEYTFTVVVVEQRTGYTDTKSLTIIIEAN